MQSGLRKSRKDFLKMLEYIESGGKFNKESIEGPLICFTKFEDGKLFIRDGLHRLCAVQIGRRYPPSGFEEFTLEPDEYMIEEMTYSMFLEINLDKGFYTPFDPRTHVRKPDFSDFKNKVLQLLSDKKDPTEFILSNSKSYLIERNENMNSINKIYAKHLFDKNW